jgi:Flp pilus assembly pilin Flp
MHVYLRPPRMARHPGQGLVELALILVFIAVLILATLTITGQSVRDVFENVSCALSGGSCTPTTGGGGGGGRGGQGGGPPTHPTPAAVPTQAGVCPVRNPHCTP